MTEEDFLARWSRRKREVGRTEAVPRGEAKPVVEAPNTEATPKDEPEFDLASLPPLESINALTDVTAFLRAGVPLDLTRAALRRVWTADPAIRDFVGLAENAWDFTDPTAMPGFGPLESTEEIRRMVASIVDQIGQAAQSGAPHPEQSPSDSKVLGGGHPEEEPLRVAARPEIADENIQETPDSQVLLQSNKVDTASQHDHTEGDEVLPEVIRRGHGGALPR